MTVLTILLVIVLILLLTGGGLGLRRRGPLGLSSSGTTTHARLLGLDVFASATGALGTPNN